MLYSVYAVLNVCSIRCMLSLVYTALSECYTGCKQFLVYAVCCDRSGSWHGEIVSDNVTVYSMRMVVLWMGKRE